MTTPNSRNPETALTGMTRCIDCRFWETPTHNRTMGTCSLTASDGSLPEHPGTLAYAADMESYQAELMTSPHFGCVQGEPKPDAP